MEQQIAALRPEEQQIASTALQWLLDNSGPGQSDSAFGEFHEEHHAFLRKNPEADSRQRKRWLRFIEREGLECALWPDLFRSRGVCLTWARLQSSSRQARGAQRTTLEQRSRERVDPLQTDAPAEAAGTKRSYMALVTDATLDYSLSYELLHFAFDLNLWTDLGSKRNMHLSTPMHLLLKGHSFSSEFWRDMHRALIDLVRQKGYPIIFSTHSPFEWSWPNHCWVVDGMEKGRSSGVPAGRSSAPGACP